MFWKQSECRKVLDANVLALLVQTPHPTWAKVKVPTPMTFASNSLLPRGWGICELLVTTVRSNLTNNDRLHCKSNYSQVRVLSIKKSGFWFWILDFPIKRKIQTRIEMNRNPFPRRISIKAPESIIICLDFAFCWEIRNPKSKSRFCNRKHPKLKEKSPSLVALACIRLSKKLSL